MERWQNKIAVVTGASAGIGAATCKALVEKGMIVVGLARRLEKMENQTRLLIEEQYRNNFHCYKCDVGNEESVKEAFAWIDRTFGGVHVLINNAGVCPKSSLLAADNSQAINAVVNTNLLAVVWCTREAFRIMKQHNFDGHIILVNSLAGHKIPHTPGFSFHIYAPAKHALTAMTEVLRQDFLTEGTKIKVTSISPAGVLTEIVSDVSFLAEGPILKTEDIADAIVYCIQTPPHVQIHDMIIRPVGDTT